jgi:hypothetical protein
LSLSIITAVQEGVLRNMEKNCESCIYFFESGNPRGNCMRFARFVDHAINDTTRDCEYWEKQQ